MTRSLAWLVAGGITFWLLVFYPARLLWGETAVAFSAVAAILCLIPTAATLIWSEWAFRSSPEQQLLAVMGGTGLRMLFVAGVGIAMFLLSDYFHQQSFLVWVVVFYLVTLTLEISVLLAGKTLADSKK